MTIEDEGDEDMYEEVEEEVKIQDEEVKDDDGAPLRVI